MMKIIAYFISVIIPEDVRLSGVNNVREGWQRDSKGDDRCSCCPPLEDIDSTLCHPSKDLERDRGPYRWDIADLQRS